MRTASDTTLNETKNRENYANSQTVVINVNMLWLRYLGGFGRRLFDGMELTVEKAARTLEGPGELDPAGRLRRRHSLQPAGLVGAPANYILDKPLLDAPQRSSLPKLGRPFH